MGSKGSSCTITSCLHVQSPSQGLGGVDTSEATKMLPSIFVARKSAAGGLARERSDSVSREGRLRSVKAALCLIQSAVPPAKP